MARLGSFNLRGESGSVFTASKAILINTYRVKSIQTMTGVSNVLSSVGYQDQNDRDIRQLFSSDSAATNNTEFNANAVSNWEVTIPLTVKSNDGATTIGVKYYDIKNITWVEPWPGDAADSLVKIRIDDWSSITIRVDETMAAIKALANA